MSNARPVGRPKKQATEIAYIRLPAGLMRQIRAKAHSDKRDISATVSLILEAALQSAKA